MRKLTLSGLFAIAALAVVATSGAEVSTASATMPEITPLPQAVSHIDGVPTEALPSDGRCRIFFDNVSVSKQPAEMPCEHAMWVAHSWGGRVIQVNGVEASVTATFAGRNDFTGVPADALPPRGYCRAWLDGVSADQQPEASDCVVARRTAHEKHGRVLFMPL